ncbi:hypothetical protein EPA93_14130 [Ktedonosporobacter rubrisoli]|uniref:Uncharacterized protein n=1 Tax=Ktedonosporobacter rubrisoli TaxID=2509675 RepID=A0A4V0YYQ9_KTERU|nr:hypothetical protein [Ktedonosporobacter rubrisoli]QBD77081.1 hypothetical protein EPA93_14130 [Ktedonosporobacter rubrisoli]
MSILMGSMTSKPTVFALGPGGLPLHIRGPDLVLTTPGTERFEERRRLRICSPGQMVVQILCFIACFTANLVVKI